MKEKLRVMILYHHRTLKWRRKHQVQNNLFFVFKTPSYEYRVLSLVISYQLSTEFCVASKIKGLCTSTLEGKAPFVHF